MITMVNATMRKAGRQDDASAISGHLQSIVVSSILSWSITRDASKKNRYSGGITSFLSSSYTKSYFAYSTTLLSLQLGGASFEEEKYPVGIQISEATMIMTNVGSTHQTLGGRGQGTTTRQCRPLLARRLREDEIFISH
jgi:hypothetical protein